MRKIVAGVSVFSSLLLGSLFYASEPLPIPAPGDKAAYRPEDQTFKATFVQSHYYEGVEGTRNYLEVISRPENPIASPLLIITGIEDITENWWATAQRALELGFRNLYIIELRGQGRSQRTRNNFNGSIHINDFNNYSDDILRALQSIEKTFGPPESPPFAIAHSTGTLALTHTLSRLQTEPSSHWVPQKISFWGPLVKPDISPLLNNTLVRPLLAGLDQLGTLFGRTLLGRHFPERDFAENRVTTSQERYEWSENLRLQEGLRSSGISLRWALEMAPVAETLMADGYSSVTQPLLVLKAEDDQIVRNDWHLKNPMVQVETIAGAQHALHLERPEIFDEVVTQTFRFFLKQ
jgi:alpha-beta hydrolase superfamily lysophospholipase